MPRIASVMEQAFISLKVLALLGFQNGFSFTNLIAGLSDNNHANRICCNRLAKKWIFAIDILKKTYYTQTRKIDKILTNPL